MRKNIRGNMPAICNVFLSSLSLESQLSRDANAGLLYDKTAIVGVTIKRNTL